MKILITYYKKYYLINKYINIQSIKCFSFISSLYFLKSNHQIAWEVFVCLLFSFEEYYLKSLIFIPILMRGT